jgi:hypothetical protein
MRYSHVKIPTPQGPKWAILEWSGLGQDLPNVRLTDSCNAQTQMLTEHAPLAVAKLLELGHIEIIVIVMTT